MTINKTFTYELTGDERLAILTTMSILNELGKTMLQEPEKLVQFGDVDANYRDLNNAFYLLNGVLESCARE